MFLLVIEAGASLQAASVGEEVVHLLVVTVVVGKRAHLGEHRHAHVQGVAPPPVVALRRVHHAVEGSLDVPDAHRLRIVRVQLEVSLAATLVVGHAVVGIAVGEAPIVTRPPLHGVLVIPRIGIDPVQRHQPFVVGSPRPEIAWSGLVSDDVFTRVRPFAHEVVIGLVHLR